MDFTGQKQELKLYSQYALSSVKLSGIEKEGKAPTC